MSNNYQGAIAAQTRGGQEAEALGLRGARVRRWIGVARAKNMAPRDHGAAAVAFDRAADAAGDSPTEKQRADLAGSLAQLEIGRGELEAGMIDALLAIRLTHDPKNRFYSELDLADGLLKAGGERLRSSAGRRQVAARTATTSMARAAAPSRLRGRPTSGRRAPRQRSAGRISSSRRKNSKADLEQFGKLVGVPAHSTPRSCFFSGTCSIRFPSATCW